MKRKSSHHTGKRAVNRKWPWGSSGVGLRRPRYNSVHKLRNIELNTVFVSISYINIHLFSILLKFKRLPVIEKRCSMVWLQPFQVHYPPSSELWPHSLCTDASLWRCPSAHVHTYLLPSPGWLSSPLIHPSTWSPIYPSGLPPKFQVLSEAVFDLLSRSDLPLGWYLSTWYFFMALIFMMCQRYETGSIGRGRPVLCSSWLCLLSTCSIVLFPWYGTNFLYTTLEYTLSRN